MENKKVFFFLALDYNTQPYIAVHYSNEGKNFTFNIIIATLFLYIVLLKIVFKHHYCE